MTDIPTCWKRGDVRLLIGVANRTPLLVEDCDGAVTVLAMFCSEDRMQRAITILDDFTAPHIHDLS